MTVARTLSTEKPVGLIPGAFPYRSLVQVPDFLAPSHLHKNNVLLGESGFVTSQSQSPPRFQMVHGSFLSAFGLQVFGRWNLFLGGHVEAAMWKSRSFHFTGSLWIFPF